VLQSRHLQGAHYLCLLKLHFVNIANYGSTVCDEVGGGVAAYVASTDNEPPEDGVTAPQHVGAILI